MSELETKIEENLERHIQASLVSAVLSKAGTATLAELSKLTGHEKYGKVASSMRIQEFLDAYVKLNNYVQPSAGAEVASSSTVKVDKDTGGVPPLNLKDKKERAAAEVVVREVVESACGGGIAASQIVKECNSRAILCNQGQVRKLLGALVDSQLVITTGYARSTNYHWEETASEETKVQAVKDLASAKEGTSKVK